MLRGPPRSPRSDTLVPYTSRVRSVDRALQVERHRRVQWHGLEAALAGRRVHLVQVESGTGEQLLRRVTGDPALGGQARRRVVGGAQVVLRPGPGAFHHIPAVGRAGRVVDDDRRLRALARGPLNLVGPAPVMGPALSFEQALDGKRVA